MVSTSRQVRILESSDSSFCVLTCNVARDANPASSICFASLSISNLIRLSENLNLQGFEHLEFPNHLEVLVEDKFEGGPLLRYDRRVCLAQYIIGMFRH